jgi:hypothetical protein
MAKRFNSSADPGRLFGIQVEEMENESSTCRVTPRQFCKG